MWRLLCAVAVAAAASPPEAEWTRAAEGGRDGRLLQVHVLFRHGQRVPRNPYPTDPHRNSTLWDDGFSQLTAEGRRQGFALGVGLRRRYSTLLTDTRAWKVINAQSSQIPRTMMTAAVVLAGLIPPNGTDRWSSQLAWQPAPIYSRDPLLDDKLIGALPCPKLAKILNERDHPSEEVLELRRYLENNAGLPVRSLNSVEKLYTCMSIESQVGLELPHWTKKVFPDPMQKEAGRALSRSSLTPQSARLRAGPLLKELSTFDKEDIGAPIRLYSTHDTVLAGLMGALGLFSGKPPGFVATAALEYREVDGKMHVQLWWREAAGESLTRLQLPGCSERCSLERFRSILGPLIPVNWARECAISTVRGAEGFKKVGFGWWLVLCFSFSCSVMLIVAICYATLKRHDYEYLPDRSHSNKYFNL